MAGVDPFGKEKTMVLPEPLVRLIEGHRFFRGIEGRLSAMLVGCAAHEVFPTGTYLFREGVPAHTFYLVRDGLVAVEVAVPAHPPVIVDTVAEGDVLGWSWMVPPYRTAFAARAQRAVRAVAFDARCLRAAMEADAELGYAVTKRFLPVMAHRLTAARLQMLDLYGSGPHAGAAG